MTVYAIYRRSALREPWRLVAVTRRADQAATQRRGLERRSRRPGLQTTVREYADAGQVPEEVRDG